MAVFAEDGACIRTEIFLVDTGTQVFKVFDLSILAVWHLGEENCVLALRIKIFLITWVLEIVLTGAWVLLSWQVISLHLVRLEELPLDLARHEIGISRPLLHLIGFGVISCGAHSVLPETSVSLRWQLLCGYRWRTSLWLNNKIVMLIRVIALPYLL